MNMTITIFKDLLLKKDYKTIQNILNVMNAVDIALLLSELEDKELAIAFRLIPKDEASDVFSNMSSTMQAYLVEIFTEKELKELLDNLYMDDTVDMLGEFPANLVTRILDTVDSSKRNDINLLLNYPDDSAGSIMTTEYVALKRHDRARCHAPHQGSRHPQRDHLYLLRTGTQKADRYRNCQGFDDHG